MFKTVTLSFLYDVLYKVGTFFKVMQDKKKTFV